MSEARRLDGRQARLLETLSGIADDLALAAHLADKVATAEPGAADVELWWTVALVVYGRCFDRRVHPWGASEILGGLSKPLQRRHRHFKHLHETLVSQPGGVSRALVALAGIDLDGHLWVDCRPVPLFVLGKLEAMDLLELLSVLQVLVDRRRIETHNALKGQLLEMSDEDFEQLPSAAVIDAPLSRISGSEFRM